MFNTYRQNNSGGVFDKPGITVILEDGIDPESVGIYFNGVDEGQDCECCGDRWHEWPDTTEEPTVYGEPVEKYMEELTFGWSSRKENGDLPEVVIFYTSGRTKKYFFDRG